MLADFRFPGTFLPRPRASLPGVLAPGLLHHRLHNRHVEQPAARERYRPVRGERSEHRLLAHLVVRDRPPPEHETRHERLRLLLRRRRAAGHAVSVAAVAAGGGSSGGHGRGCGCGGGAASGGRAGADAHAFSDKADGPLARGGASGGAAAAAAAVVGAVGVVVALPAVETVDLLVAELVVLPEPSVLMGATGRGGGCNAS